MTVNARDDSAERDTSEDMHDNSEKELYDVC